MAKYRIDFSIQRRDDGDDDFVEIGFGSSGGCYGVDHAAAMVEAAIVHREWETREGMPAPEDAR